MSDRIVFSFGFAIDHNNVKSSVRSHCVKSSICNRLWMRVQDVACALVRAQNLLGCSLLSMEEVLETDKRTAKESINSVRRTLDRAALEIAGCQTRAGLENRLRRLHRDLHLLEAENKGHFGNNCVENPNTMWHTVVIAKCRHCTTEQEQVHNEEAQTKSSTTDDRNNDTSRVL